MNARWPSRRVLAFVAMAVVAPAAADELQATLAALQAVDSEQQALFQQFQMLQSLRANEQGAAAQAYLPQPGPPRNYDDVVREREDAIARADAYQAELDAIYDRHRQLEARKQELLERLRVLRTTPPSEQ